MWATNYTAETTQTVELPYTCASCGHRAKAVVLAYGVGTATALMGLGDGAGASGGMAKNSAQRNAERVLRAVPCPHCGKRSWGTWAAMVSRASLGMAGLAALAIVACIVGPMVTPKHPWAGVGIGLVAIGIGFWSLLGPAWRSMVHALRADQRVEFLPLL